jgi:hypothetical protein
MQRRTLMKLGIGAAAVLAIAGGGLALLRPGWSGGRLSADVNVVMRAVARAVLDGNLPADALAREAALHGHLQRLSATIGGFPAATQDELSQLLALLASPPGRMLLAGLQAPWAEATIEQLSASLQDMRTSSIALRQQRFHALRDTTNAAYFADPALADLGYPGPTAI